MSISIERKTRIFWQNSPKEVSLTKQERDGSGKWQNIGGAKTYLVDALPAQFQDGEVLRSLAAYGLQKLFQERTSQITDIDETLAYIDKFVNEALSQGNWSLPRVNATERTDYTMVLVALAELKQTSLMAVTKAWKALDAAQRKAIADRPDVKAKVAELLQGQTNVDLTL